MIFFPFDNCKQVRLENKRKYHFKQVRIPVSVEKLKRSCKTALNHVWSKVSHIAL